MSKSNLHLTISINQRGKSIRHMETMPKTDIQRQHEAREYLSWANTTANRFNKSAAFRNLNAVNQCIQG